MTTKKKSTSASLKPRIRIMRGKEIALGPGKIELLEAIDKTGSIGDAAKILDMSYMRAWKLIKTMEKCFAEPLVIAERGGRAGGGARLSSTGQKAIALYSQMEQKFLKVTQADWAELQNLLRRA